MAGLIHYIHNLIKMARLTNKKTNTLSNSRSFDFCGHATQQSNLRSRHVSVLGP